MKWKIIFIILLFVGLIALAVYLYYNFSGLDNGQFRYANLSIYAIDRNTRDFQVISYAIKLNNSAEVYKRGNTIRNGAILDRIPVNNSYKIYNEYNKSLNYYTDFFKGKADLEDNYRVILNLIKPSEAEVMQQGELGINNQINITITTKEEFRNIKLCIRWSQNIISVELLNNFTKIDNPQRYKNFDKCYLTNESLNFDNTELKISLNYMIFEENDNFIELAVIDSDYINEVLINELEGEDIFANDTIIKIY